MMPIMRGPEVERKTSVLKPPFWRGDMGLWHGSVAPKRGKTGEPEGNWWVGGSVQGLWAANAAS